EHVRDKVRDIRARAAKFGRRPEDIRVFLGMMTIVGKTRQEAEQKLKEYQHYVSMEGNFVNVGAITGIDFSKLKNDETLKAVPTNAGQPALPAYAASGNWTPDDIAKYVGGRYPVLVGDAVEVCDRLQQWWEETGIDGFNLGRIIKPGTMEDFVD